MSHLLKDSLIEALRCGLGIYALVDPSLLDGASRRFPARASPAVRARMTGVPAGGVGLNDTHALQVLPYLIDLAAPLLDEPLLDRSVQWALECHAVTWIASRWTRPDLAGMLAQRMDVTLPERQAAFLRFSDARVLPVLHLTLDEAPRADFFGVATSWWYFDREEELREVSAAPRYATQAWPTPWPLTSAQEAALLEAARPDAVLAILRRLAPHDLATVPRARRHAFVARQMAKAAEWAIDAENQIALFCLAAIERGDGFESRDGWPQRLARVKKGKCRMDEAIEAIDALESP